MYNDIDLQYMRRCLRLAANGLGRVRPNPMVGCVVVKEGRVLTEGYHQAYGGYHAERNALLRLANTAVGRQQLRGATLYVNLEPCSHYGKTPPCADLVVELGIGRVVCSCDDPNPLVAGRGFERLEAAGIEVVRHVLESEGRWLNRRFFTFMEQRRPYVILKWAESEDGFMAPLGDDPYWLSSPRQNRLNHRWRTEEAALLVGSETYQKDRPSLTARHFVGCNPLPAVMDRSHRISSLPSGWIQVDAPTVAGALQQLYEQSVQSVIVEGGRKVLDAFLESGLYDEVRILKSDQLLGDGLSAPTLSTDEHRLVMRVMP